MCGVPYHAVDAYLPKLLRAGLQGRHLRAGRGPQGGQGRRQARGHQGPDARHGRRDRARGRQGERPSSPPSPSATTAGGWPSLDLATGEVRTLEGAWTEAKLLADEIFKAGAHGDPLSRGRPRTPCAASSRSTDRRAPPSAPPRAGSSTRPRRRPRRPRALRRQSLAGFGLEDKPRAVAAAGAAHRLRQEGPAGLPGPRPPHLLPPRRRATSSSTRRPSATSSSSATSATGKAKGTLLDVIDFTMTALGGRLLRSWLLRPLLDVGGDQRAPGRRRRGPRRDRSPAASSARRSRASTTSSGSVGKIAAGRGQPARPRRPQTVAGPAAGDRARASAPSRVRSSQDMSEPLGQRRRRRRPHRQGHPRRARLPPDRGRDHQGRLQRRARRAALGQPVRQGLDRPAREPRAGADRHRLAQGRLQQGLRLLHRGDQAQPATRSRPTTSASRPWSNAERYITPELKEYEEKVLGAEERIGGARVRPVPRAPRGRGRARPQRLQRIAAGVAALDVLAGPGRAAPPGANYVPARGRRGRRDPHRRRPAPRARDDAEAEPFVPNDTRARRPRRTRSCSSPARTWRGKSHLHPPGRADRRSWPRWALRPGRVGDASASPTASSPASAPATTSARGQSTFMVEMTETANILNNATAAEPGHPRRDRPRHEHLRRPAHRLGRRRAPARRERRLPRRSSPRTTTS